MGETAVVNGMDGLGRAYEKVICEGLSLVAQWMRLHAPNAGDPGAIPGQGTRSHTLVTAKGSHATTVEPASRN